MNNSLLFSPSFSEPIEQNLNVYLQINTVKYNVDREIMINYEKLQIVLSHFFILLQMLVYIWSNSKLFSLSVFRFNLFDK
jgi:hypothetical protein